MRKYKRLRRAKRRTRRITPVRKPKDRDLHMSEHDYNDQISSLRAPVE